MAKRETVPFPRGAEFPPVMKPAGSVPFPNEKYIGTPINPAKPVPVARGHCPICRKGPFKTEAKLRGHIAGAHPDEPAQE